MLHWIKDLVAKANEPAILDPFFGGLYDEGEFYWARVHFRPANATIEVLIPHRGDGPHDWQRDFFKGVTEQYSSLEADLMSAAVRAVSRELPPGQQGEYLNRPPAEHVKEFVLETVSLPEADSAEAKWGVNYFCRTTGHHYDVHLRGWRITYAENIGG
jgi:hypothetical protein